MRIGVIYVGHQTAQYIGPSLAPWIRARNMQLNGDQYVICAVSVPFVGFPNDEAPDATVEMLKGYESDDSIDKLLTSNQPVHETEARGAALDWLIGQGAEILIQVDSDELFALEQIDRIMALVRREPFVCWFRLCLKNYVFDTSTYLVEPFCPARIHRVRFGALTATHFVADNDIAYGVVNPRDLSTMTIPQSIAWIKHMTWGNNLRSKRKIAYHENHFNSRPSGVRSSFRWEEEKGLVFNEAYYQYVGLPMPQLARD